MVRFEFEDFDPYSVAEPYRQARPSGRSLCDGCKHAHLYRRRDRAEVAVYCHELGKYVPPDIVECSQFSAVAALSLHQMQQIALPIDPRPGVSDGSYR
ncbi:MAG TPA: hypothetical protein VGV13_16830 [Methylomirabilota bacterium]|jgi:hypothetical protein|nr:hypothetical protein [Methylomirabilota bacterium]